MAYFQASGNTSDMFLTKFRKVISNTSTGLIKAASNTNDMLYILLTHVIKAVISVMIDVIKVICNTGA